MVLSAAIVGAAILGAAWLTAIPLQQMAERPSEFAMCQAFAMDFLMNKSTDRTSVSVAELDAAIISICTMRH